MSEPQRDDLMSHQDKKQVRALNAARAYDRAKLCTHPELTKVIDRLGMMTTTMTAQGPITCADVLEAHYECKDCGKTLLSTANHEAQRSYDTYCEAAEKFEAVLDSFDGVRRALSQRKETRS